MTEPCEHFAAIRPVEPQSDRCESCAALGEPWTALRVCLTCGHVGCCEDSPHAHALRHHQATGHPMIASLGRRDTWGWCYLHHRYFDPMPGRLPRRRSRIASWLRRVLRRT